MTFSLGIKSVTLEGDVYDPSGTLSGGSAPNSSRIFIQVQELIGVEDKLREARGALSYAVTEEEKNQPRRLSWKNLARDLEIKQHELKLLQEQVEGSNASLVSSFSVLHFFKLTMVLRLQRK